MAYKFTFGRYKNKAITEVPTAYIKWLVGSNAAFHVGAVELERRKELKNLGVWDEPKNS